MKALINLYFSPRIREKSRAGLYIPREEKGKEMNAIVEFVNQGKSLLSPEGTDLIKGSESFAIREATADLKSARQIFTACSKTEDPLLRHKITQAMAEKTSMHGEA